MAAILPLEKILWALTMLAAVVLAGMVVYRKNYKPYPFFFSYLLAMLMQNLAFVVIYQRWGFRSPAARLIGWGMQGLVTSARALAVAEICLRALGKYRGIWGLAWRLLIAAVAFVFVYSWGVSRGSWQFALLNMDRSLELAIAAVVVIFFAFIRHYEVDVDPGLRLIATGFFLYSCFLALNDTLLEGLLQSYGALWNFLGTLAFLASVLLWTWVMREKQLEIAAEPKMLTAGVYRTLVPQVNARLRMLDEHLVHFWDKEEKRP